MGTVSTFSESVTLTVHVTNLDCCGDRYHCSLKNAVTFPLDITKTRLQIQGQKEKLLKDSGVKPLKNGIRAHRGMLRTLIGISMYSYSACVCEGFMISLFCQFL